ncbi:large ribosomal subunit protein uL13m-like isoform X2 [Dysidea avara]|uniref:large ribosomal subunit protein uL13m-like isoform X2 n=1 Tax=Dysidea avara TaxID=196820 RepID=UPI0033288C91
MASPLSNSIHTFTRLWYKIDCRGQVVGRLAIQASQLLQGKTKPIYHPAVDVGDHVILTNTRHVAFTGNKWKDKLYRHHTGYPGGLHTMTAEKLHDKDPTLVIKKAIYDDMDKDHPYNQNVTHEILGVTIVPRALEEYTQEEINNYPKLIEWNE